MPAKNCSQLYGNVICITTYDDKEAHEWVLEQVAPSALLTFLKQYGPVIVLAKCFKVLSEIRYVDLAASDLL